MASCAPTDMANSANSVLHISLLTYVMAIYSVDDKFAWVPQSCLEPPYPYNAMVLLSKGFLFVE